MTAPQMATFEDIQELAAGLGIEVRAVPAFPNFCQLMIPTRQSPWWCQFRMREDEPVRMMPPLRLDTAEQFLAVEQKIRKVAS